MGQLVKKSLHSLPMGQLVKKSLHSLPVGQLVKKSLHSLPMGQLVKKSLFRRKEDINSYPLKSSFEIVNFLLEVKKLKR
jgi:hypothetical protein